MGLVLGVSMHCELRYVESAMRSTFTLNPVSSHMVNHTNKQWDRLRNAE